MVLNTPMNYYIKTGGITVYVVRVICLHLIGNINSKLCKYVKLYCINIFYLFVEIANSSVFSNYLTTPIYSNGRKITIQVLNSVLLFCKF